MEPVTLATLMSDASVTDICLNGVHSAFADRGRGLEPIDGYEDQWSADAMQSWVLEKLSAAGRTWDARHPFVDATLSEGFRLQATFPPIARQGVLVSLRRLPRAPDRGAKRWGEGFELLSRIVNEGDSLILAGATGSGKTTLAQDLLAEVPPHERIIALEDTPELAPRHPHFLSLVSRSANADGAGEVTLRTLLRQTLRMRPDRIVLGECRGPEVLELLQALNTGHRGALATLHANSAREALSRIELLCLLGAAGAIPLSAIRGLLASGLQWVAYVHRHGPVREIAEIWRIEGREGDTLLLRPVFGANPAII